MHAPGAAVDASSHLIGGDYSAEARLVPLGFDTLEEERLRSFLLHVDATMRAPGGLFAAHGPHGFINRDLGHVDIFWSYIFSARLAGVSPGDCAAGICEAVGPHYVKPLTAPTPAIRISVLAT